MEFLYSLRKFEHSYPLTCMLVNWNFHTSKTHGFRLQDISDRNLTAIQRFCLEHEMRINRHKKEIERDCFFLFF